MTTDRKLADGWRWVHFGDVVRQVKDRVDPETAGLDRFVAGEHMDTDDLRIRRWGEIGAGYLGPAFHMRFRPGHVLYGSRRTYLRKVAVADFEGICANTTFVVEPSTQELLPEFLPHVMTTEAFHDHSTKQSKGSVNPYINFKDLTWYEFPLPPVEEQHRIVDVLAAANRSSDTAGCTIGAVRVLRDAIVREAAASAPEHPLGDLLSACDYGISIAPAETGDLPILRMNNLDGEELSFDDLRWISASEVTDAELVQPGDVLFNRTNSIEHVGKVALVPKGIDRMTFASYLIRLRVVDGVALPAFVAGFLQSSTGRARIGRYVSRGVSQANVNSTNLRKVLVPVPPLPIQRRTVEQWEAARSVQAAATDLELRSRVAAGRIREHLLQGATR